MEEKKREESVKDAPEEKMETNSATVDANLEKDTTLTPATEDANLERSQTPLPASGDAQTEKIATTVEVHTPAVTTSLEATIIPAVDAPMEVDASPEAEEVETAGIDAPVDPVSPTHTHEKPTPPATRTSNPSQASTLPCTAANPVPDHILWAPLTTYKKLIWAIGQKNDNFLPILRIFASLINFRPPTEFSVMPPFPPVDTPQEDAEMGDGQQATRIAEEIAQMALGDPQPISKPSTPAADAIFSSDDSATAATPLELSSGLPTDALAATPTPYTKFPSTHTKYHWTKV
ncbi:mucin-7-like [Diachasma alloeum]|uniref:mucin-7-like n=1 Tax=Diachasma alloeum TaxID=454923 RepID=UPI0007383DA6|nr:mucin-7-like [Diachasma alloeum]